MVLFTSYARRNLGGGKVTKILNYKEKTDPDWLINPGSYRKTVIPD